MLKMIVHISDRKFVGHRDENHNNVIITSTMTQKYYKIIHLLKRFFVRDYNVLKVDNE